MVEAPKDCMSCANSMVTEDDELFCIIFQTIVDDHDDCEHYN
jgi:hypothetical protein